MANPAPIIARARFILLDVWRQLPPAQQAALRRAVKDGAGRRLVSTTHQRCAESLAAKGFAEVEQLASGARSYPLTPDGLLLRDVGLAADAVAARRRYSKRKEVRTCS